MEASGIRVSDDGRTISEWIGASCLSDRLRDDLADANVLIVPDTYYPDHEIVAFPARALDLLHFLRDRQGTTLRVEICSDDESFQTLQLHSRTLILPELVVESLAFPFLANLVSDYVNRYFEHRREQGLVTFRATLQNSSIGSLKTFEFTGPALSFERSLGEISKLIGSMGGSDEDTGKDPDDSD